MIEDDFSHYDQNEYDPYIIEGSTCLLNYLGITDTASLNEAENRLTFITLSELLETPVNGNFDLAHLQEIHQRIFCDIYPFSGEIRTCEISKRGQFFLPHREISRYALSLFSDLKNENLLQGLDKDAFSDRAGEYLARINLMHPFREGNGRTQRIFIDQLAAANGYVIEWNAISQQAMVEACSEYMKGIDPTAHKLKRMILINIHDRPR